MTTNDKYEVEGYFNSKTSRQNIMYTLFYSNIYQFAGNLEGIIDVGTYKTFIQNMQKLRWKEITSLLMMYQCWFTVVVFHNILNFMTELRKN